MYLPSKYYVCVLHFKINIDCLISFLGFRTSKGENGTLWYHFVVRLWREFMTRLRGCIEMKLLINTQARVPWSTEAIMKFVKKWELIVPINKGHSPKN